MKKLLIVISLFASLIISSFAANCGGVIECSCGDTVVDYYELKEDLICENSGLIIKTNQFNCNKNSIIGYNKSFGLLIQGVNYVEINNCNIENFNIGIEIKSKMVLKSNGWGSFWYEEIKSKNTKISNSIFKNNNIGIKTTNSISDEFYNNEFINNSEFGLYLDFSYSQIWNNSFFNSQIYYSNTKGKNFCNNNNTISNIYYGIKGPECNCITPLNNLIIDSKINFCSGEFEVSNIDLRENSNIYCNQTTLRGNSNNLGILINGRKNTLINFCNFTNYKTAILVKTRQEMQYSSLINFDSYDNIILNSSFYNLSIGIEFQNNHKGKVINSTFNEIKENPINLFSKSVKIYGNNFYNQSPNFTSTIGKEFCYNGILNNYFNGAQILGCNCFKPFSNLIINSNVVLCSGEYKLENPIKIQADNIKLLCNNTHLIGEDKNSAIQINGRQNNLISNCKISNFKIGIDIKSDYRREQGQFRDITYPSRKNILNNLSIFDVQTGINMDYSSNQNAYGLAEYLNNSFILSRNLVINNQGPFNILINNSYFGTNQLNNLSSRFKQFEYINLKNYQFGSDVQVLDFNFDKNNNLIISKEKDKFFKYDFEIQIYFQKDNNIIDNHLIFIEDDFIKKKIINLSEEFEIENYDKIYLKIDPKEKLKNKNIYFLNFFEFELNFKNINFEKNKKGSFEDLVFNFETNFKLIEKDFLNTLNKNFNISEEKFNIKINLKLIKDNQSSSIFPFEVEIKSNQNQNIDQKIINISSTSIFGIVNGLNHYKNNFDFFNSNTINKYYSKDDFSGLKIYDYLLNSNYSNNLSNEFFLNKINNILSQNYSDKKEYYFTIEILEENLTYKIWKFETNYSKNLINYLDNQKIPIVLGGGLFSDITTWESLAEQLSNDGYLVYLIELTGGKDSHCFNCYNYDYLFLVNKVFPKYLNFILEDSNSSKIKYVGHSNGARVVLDYLSLNENSTNQIDTFIAVGVPGAFQGNSFLFKTIKKSKPILDITLKDKNHVSIYDLVTLGFNQIPLKSSLISKNLWETYISWMFDENKEQPGKEIIINNFKLISGNFLLSGNDGIVTIKDQNAIFENVNIGVLKKSEHIITLHPHLMMSSFPKIQREIKEFLKDD